MGGRAHQAIDGIYSKVGSITLPFSSTGFEMSKTASIEATAIQIDENAMKRPGHILQCVFYEVGRHYYN